METLHLRAEHSTIEKLLGVINQIAQEGKEVEVLDNTIFDIEQKMILKGLIEEQKSEIFEHDDLWNDLLK